LPAARKAVPVAPRKFLTVQLPSLESTILGAIAGVLVALLQFKVFGGDVAVNNYISIAIAGIGVFVSPITGSAFRKLFHFSAAASTAINGIIGVGVVLSTQVPSETVRGVLIVALGVASYLGFGPSVVSGVGVTSVVHSPAAKVVWK
jgi:hypothetical protein